MSCIYANLKKQIIQFNLKKTDRHIKMVCITILEQNFSKEHSLPTERDIFYYDSCTQKLESENPKCDFEDVYIL